MKKLMKKIPIYLIILLASFDILGQEYALAQSTEQPNQISAQTDGITSEITEDQRKNTEEDTQKALADLINSDNEDAADPIINKPEVPKTGYQKYFSFDTNRTLKGTIASTEFYFEVPEYWDTKFIYAAIDFDISKMIRGDIPASLTLYLNGIPINTCNVSYENGGTQQNYITIPVDKLKEGFNVIQITSFVQLYASAGCTEAESDANWMTINDSSYIYAGYEMINPQNLISFYPYPFISTANPTGEGTAILVSDQATNSEIAAALYLSADLGTNTEEKNEIRVGLYKDRASINAKNIILISETKNFPEEYKNFLKENPNNINSTQLDLSTRTMIRSANDPEGNQLLLIASDKGDNLMEAVNMLLDGERVSQEKTSITFVMENSAQNVYNQLISNRQGSGDYTLEKLTGSGLTFVGPFHREQLIYLPFGTDYVLDSTGKISMRFRYSENLNFTRSMITVYWGDIPIASKKLSKDKASDDELSFTMPADVIGTAAGSIKVAFDLEIEDLFCSLRQEQMPWAYITKDSEFYLPASENTNLSFGNFPAPYQSYDSFSDVLIVTGDQPESTELNLLGRLMGVYGYDVSPYGRFKVIRAGEFTPEDADYNIITAGTINRNSFLRLLNDNLDFHYDETGTYFKSNESLILSTEYSRNIAAFQLIKSPYAKDRALLAVCGTSDKTLDTALHFLTEYKKRFDLKGDCVLVSSDLETKNFVFMKNDTEEAKPNFEEFVEKNKQPMLFMVMSVSAMGILLLTAILILIRSRRHLRRDKEQ